MSNFFMRFVRVAGSRHRIVTACATSEMPDRSGPRTPTGAAAASTSRDSGLRECVPESWFGFAGHGVSIDMPLLRILVVEDHAPFRHLICTALQRRAEFQTIEAADGLEAVQKAEELQPDLILLDINLPKLHGFEVAKRIRRLAPHARLLFLSQESSSDIVREAFQFGRPWLHSEAICRD